MHAIQIISMMWWHAEDKQETKLLHCLGYPIEQIQYKRLEQSEQYQDIVDLAVSIAR